jgi:hypothetical protein
MSRLTFDGKVILDPTVESEWDHYATVGRWPWQIYATVDCTTVMDYSLSLLLPTARRLAERRLQIGGH